MAGVGTMAGQVALVAELRWRMFRNTLHTSAGQMEVVARVVLTVLAGIGALAIGVTLGTLAYVALDTKRWPLLGVVAWAIFGCWLVVPVVLAGMGIEFDFRNLLRFPLRFSSFVALSLLYGLFDPPSLVAMFWTACVATGLALARPGLLPAVLLILLLFSLVNLLLNRALLGWLDKLLAKRRTREALFAVFLLAVVGLQLAGALAERLEDKLGPWLSAATPLLALTPPGAVTESLGGVARGEASGVIGGTAVLLAYATGTGLLLRRRVRAQYLGEELGEGVVAKREAHGTEPGWHLPGVSGAVAAMCEKELRYAFRNAQTWMALVIPPVLVLFFSVAWGDPADRPPFISRSPEQFLLGVVAYVLLVATPSFLHNVFAYDGRGIQFLLAAPARWQEILLAKNLVNGSLVLATSLATLLLACLLFEPPGAGLLAMMLSGAVYVTLAQVIIGNALSIYFPRPIEFGSLRKRASQVSVLLGILSQVVVFGVAWAILRYSRFAAAAQWAWAAAIALLLLSVIAAWLYRNSLNVSARTLIQRREKLLTELTR